MDLVLNLPHLTLVGKDSLCIQNHGGLLAYASDLIKIKTTLGILTVEGRKLMVSKITQEQIELKGTITQLSYD